ncbi:hypothetical protein AHAS_Ahas12G0087300 [Arachis hypogaea]
MDANKRGRPRLKGTSEGTSLDATAIFESINAMATAVCDSVAATNQIAKCLDCHNGTENNHETRRKNGNGDEGEFNRNTSATQVDDWFKEIERLLRARQVPEAQGVEFAAYLLRNDAQYWWQDVLQLLGKEADNITSEEFSTEFYKKYFSQCFRTAKELELLQLRQGNMTVTEYTHKFEELCRFSNIC